MKGLSLLSSHFQAFACAKRTQKSATLDLYTLIRPKKLRRVTVVAFRLTKYLRSLYFHSDYDEKEIAPETENIITVA